MASSRNSRSTDTFAARVGDSLQALIPPAANVTLALSGGLDSRVLLALAAEHAAAAAGAYHLSAIHIHHGLSPHADQWAEFCMAICAQAAVPLQVIKISVPSDTGEGLEATARRLRYRELDACQTDYILLAHHCNDQAETVLLNLMRGAGVKGAAAMQTISGDAGRYRRPLLNVTRTEIESYAQEHALSWIDDESNTDTTFTRNYVRLNVMPVLSARFPAAVENLARAAEHFAEAQQMLDEMAVFDLTGQPAAFPLSMDILKRLSVARACNVLRYLLGQAGLQTPSASRMKEALRQFLEAAPDRHPCLDLPAYRLLRRKGQILLELA